MTDTVLVFELEGCRLGLDASCVATIDRLPALTQVPLLPSYVAGICNLRGSVVPVVDLAKLWGVPHTGEYRCILLLRWQGAEVALMADRVTETRSRAGALAAGGGAESGFGQCVTALLEDQTAVLDADLLLDNVFQRTEEKR